MKLKVRRENMRIKNPLPIKNIGDPYVLCVDNKYYLYATSHFNGYYCWVSDDMTAWSKPKICYTATEKSFGNSCFWAPEVYQFGSKFYMYYTAQWKKYKEEQLRIGVAVADSPLGPFEDVFDNKPMFDFGYGVLDAHILKDDNANYLYYSRASEGHVVNGAKEGQIYVTELGDNLISVKSEGKLILRPEQAWEKQNPEEKMYWNEGQFVIKRNNKYHMMYSANFFESIHHAIGGAVADTPTGPFIKYENNPVLSSTDNISGPGHNSVVKGADGTYYCVYHAHSDFEKRGKDRQVYITPLFFKNDKIYIRHPEID